MAKWNNNKFKTWLVEINATKLSQEKLKSKAVMFCGDFGKVDKKTISKIVEDFKEEHNRVVANVPNSIFEEVGGREGKMRNAKCVFRLGLVVDKTWFDIFASELLSHQRLKCVHICCLAWLGLQLLSTSVDLKISVPK